MGESSDIPALIPRRAALRGLAMLAVAPALTGQALSATQTPFVLQTLEPLRTKFGLPAIAGAVAVKGDIIAYGVSGTRIRGAAFESSPYVKVFKVTPVDRFHLGSDTKAMTALLVGMAVDQGKLQWDSTIGSVLAPAVPKLNPQLAAVTIEQLLSHSGGIPRDTEEMKALYFSTDAFNYNLTPLRLRMIDAWKSHAPQTTPGTQFAYANFGYLIAGAMLEMATQVPWEEMIRLLVFEPLKLTTAGLGPQATPGKIDAPVGHAVAEDGSVTPMLWGAAADLPPCLGPAGVAHMSVLDFARWAAWNAGRARRAPALVKPETLARIHHPHIDTGKIPHPRPGVPTEGAYALGWGVVKFPWTRGRVLTHNGSNGMNLAKVLVDTDNDVAVALLTNFPGDPADDAVNAAMEALYRHYAPA